MIPEHATKKLQGLEEALGSALADMPVAVRDQFTTTIRDDFTKMHLDITNPEVAEAAFAGAFILADAVFSEPLASARVAQFTAYLLRNLFSRAQGESVSTSMLPHVRPSWRMRLMDWLSK
jgi:hypothetical protein